MFRTISAFVGIVITIVELLLSSRLILKFFAANPRTPFVAWVYGVTAPLVSPFAKIHPDWRLSGYVLDSSTLAALIVYVVIGGLVVRMLLSPFRRKTDT